MGSIRKLGWLRDLPDYRDLVASVKLSLKELPSKVDLRGKCPPIYNQGNLGSCTAFAAGAAVQFTKMEKKEVAPLPSMLFTYFNTRVLHGTVDEDSGASIRNTFKALAKVGYCRSAIWPYKVSEFRKQPPKVAYDDAAPRKIKVYASVVQHQVAICDAIAAGDPVVFGFTVYDNFKPNAKGEIPMPRKGDRAQGGHAIVLVGYDDSRKAFLIRNSWGTGWGLKGYAWMPYGYVLNPKLASDFWVLRDVP